MDAQEKKLRQTILGIAIAGVLLTIILAVVLVTQVINKQRTEITKAKAEYTTHKAEADQLDEELVLKQKAEDSREYVTGQLAFFRQRYRSLPFGALEPAQVTTPGLDAVQKATQVKSNREVAWRRWMNEYSNGYGPVLERELLFAANQAGVRINTSVKVGDPPKAPEESIPPTNSLLRPTGGPLAISITGSLDELLEFFNRINQSSILMMVGNDLKLTGYSPNITATFSLTPYLLATGDGAPVTAAAAGGAPTDGAGSALGASPSVSSGGGSGGSSNGAVGGASNSG